MKESEINGLGSEEVAEKIQVVKKLIEELSTPGIGDSLKLAGKGCILCQEQYWERFCIQLLHLRQLC